MQMLITNEEQRKKGPEPPPNSIRADILLNSIRTIPLDGPPSLPFKRIETIETALSIFADLIDVVSIKITEKWGCSTGAPANLVGGFGFDPQEFRRKEKEERKWGGDRGVKRRRRGDRERRGGRQRRRRGRGGEDKSWGREEGR